MADGIYLEQYAFANSQEAFDALQKRYSELVYSACFRELRNRELTEDAMQAVFLLLARKSRSLRSHPSIAGWLFASARLIAKNMARQENRLRARERLSSLENNTSPLGTDLWEEIEPYFNEAVSRLKPADRDAVLLRFFQNQSYAELADNLGISENTARMRINRALEKIRDYLRKSEIDLSTLTLLNLFERNSKIGYSAEVRSAPSPISVKAFQRALFISQLLLVVQIALPILIAITALNVFGIAQLSSVSLTPTEKERSKFWSEMKGEWLGKMQFADDKTQTRSSYTSKAFVESKGSDHVTITTSYPGSSRVDTIDLAKSPAGTTFLIKNLSPLRSYPLDGTYALSKATGGAFEFIGFSPSISAAVRFTLSFEDGQFVMSQELRRGASDRFIFRNRYAFKHVEDAQSK